MLPLPPARQTPLRTRRRARATGAGSAQAVALADPPQQTIGDAPTCNNQSQCKSQSRYMTVLNAHNKHWTAVRTTPTAAYLDALLAAQLCSHATGRYTGMTPFGSHLSSLARLAAEMATVAVMATATVAVYRTVRRVPKRSLPSPPPSASLHSRPRARGGDGRDGRPRRATTAATPRVMMARRWMREQEPFRC